jgi:hypothetical protein
MRAANNRAAVSVSSDDADDISFKPLSWWRVRWHDPEIQRLFIENFIYVRDAFDENKLTRLVLNDIQQHLHNNLTGRDAVLKSRRQGLSAYFKARYFAKCVVLKAVATFETCRTTRTPRLSSEPISGSCTRICRRT